MNKLSLFWQVYTVLVYTCICMQCILCTCMHVYLIVQLINLIISYMYAVWYFKSYSFRLFWTISNTLFHVYENISYSKSGGNIFHACMAQFSILNIFPKVYRVPLFQFKVQYTPTFKVSFLKMQFVCKRRLMIKFYAQCIFLKISCKFGNPVFSNAL